MNHLFLCCAQNQGASQHLGHKHLLNDAKALCESFAKQYEHIWIEQQIIGGDARVPMIGYRFDIEDKIWAQTTLPLSIK